MSEFCVNRFGCIQCQPHPLKQQRLSLAQSKSPSHSKRQALASPLGRREGGGQRPDLNTPVRRLIRKPCLIRSRNELALVGIKLKARMWCSALINA